MKYLHDAGFKAIAMRDLAKYVDWRQKPSDPWKIIEERKARLREALWDKWPVPRVSRRLLASPESLIANPRILESGSGFSDSVIHD
jgi:hypothetical protein